MNNSIKKVNDVTFPFVQRIEKCVVFGTPIQDVLRSGVPDYIVLGEHKALFKI